MNMTWFLICSPQHSTQCSFRTSSSTADTRRAEALMLAKKPRRLWMFSAMIAFFSTVTALACRALEMIPVLSTLPSALHFAMFSGVLIVVFLITGLILKLALGATEKFLGTLGMAALNTLVLATPCSTVARPILSPRASAPASARVSRSFSRRRSYAGSAHNLAESGYAQSLPRHSGGVRLRRAALARVLRLLGQLPVLIIN